MPELCEKTGPDGAKCELVKHEIGNHIGKNASGTSTRVWTDQKFDRKRTTWRYA